VDADAALAREMISGFQAVLALWAWTLTVTLYAAWRSMLGPEQDPIRPSGPTR